MKYLNKLEMGIKRSYKDGKTLKYLYTLKSLLNP